MLLITPEQPFAFILAVGLFYYAYKYKPKNKITSQNDITPIKKEEEKPAEDQAEEPPISSMFTFTATTHAHFFFRVAGITKKNDEGEPIQKNIRNFVDSKIEYDGYSYEGMTNKEIYEDGSDIYEVDISGDYEITLEPEPDNPYDPNAVKVIHNEIGHVGYVPRESTKEALDAVGGTYEIKWRLIGGKYKYLDHDADKVKVKTLNYGIMVDVFSSYS